MQTSAHLIKEPDAKAVVGTTMTYRSLLKADAFSEGILSDISNGNLDDALHSLGLKRYSIWIHRDPDAEVSMWEGTEIDTLLERFGTSSHPVLARWRDEFRVLSGPEAAENFWDASRQGLFSWTADQEGEDSRIRVFRGTAEVQALVRLFEDIGNDAAHLRIFDRIRRDQGFTRIEMWTQQVGEETLLLNLYEGHNLERSLSLLEAESNRFDKRMMQARRAAERGPRGLAQPAAKLLVDWRG